VRREEKRRREKQRKEKKRERVNIKSKWFKLNYKIQFKTFKYTMFDMIIYVSLFYCYTIISFYSLILFHILIFLLLEKTTFHKYFIVFLTLF
jgi:hypothetical protein